MPRSFLTPKRAAVGLVLLALLLVGGLAWVSVAALHAEADRTRADAEASTATRQHLALWRLDTHLLGPLGVENNRPFTNFTPLAAPAPVVFDATGQPSADPGRVPSPLLSADLPAWMLLHFELDTEAGWRSPQVLPPDLAAALDAEPLSLPLTNVTPARDTALTFLRHRLPAATTVAALAAADRRDPFVGYILPVPLSDEPAVGRPGTLIDGSEPHGRGRPSVFLADPSDGIRQAGEARGYAAGPPTPPAPAQPKAEPPPGSEPAGTWRTPPRTDNTTDIRPPPPPDPPLSAESRARKDAFDQLQATRGGADWSGLRAKAPPVPPGTGASKPGPLPSDDAYRATVTWTERVAKNILDRQTQELEAHLRELTATLEPKPTAAGGASGRFGLAVAKGGDPTGQAATPKTGAVTTPAAVRLGPIRPRWLHAADGSRVLLLVRTAEVRGRVVYQGVLLDWPAVRAELAALVDELYPHGELVPLADGDPAASETTMTTLPVRLEGHDPPGPPAVGLTPLRIGLVIAWAAVLLAITVAVVGGRAALVLSAKRMRFASAVTHELRTPLTALQLHLDLLTSGLITDEAKKAEYLATLAAEADRLNRLVENVLDFAKLERSSALAGARRVPVVDLLSNLEATWADRLATDGFTFSVERHTPAGQAVVFDPRVLEQVLGNLIDNARKYSRQSADRRIRVRAIPAGGHRVAVEVEDRGPGVPVGEVKAIFKPFSRGSTSTETGGAGLGLSLAKDWAELFGGSLSYHPASGGGACFRLELPG